MPTSMHSSFRAILDKGTLDAIASGGSSAGQDDTEASTAAAIAYLQNMWALLVTGGMFIIITTMPPAIFNMLGQQIMDLPPAARAAGPTSCVSTSHYEVRPLKTDVGGDVFYYVLTKSAASSSSASALGEKQCDTHTDLTSYR
jgi:hypothetical protein